MNKDKSLSMKNFTFAGITIPEIAIIGAAGFVVWKNRDNIRNFLDTKGIEVPSILSEDLKDILQSGLGLISGKDSSADATPTRRGGRSAARNKEFHDA